MLYLSGVQPLAGIFYLVWIVYKIGLCVYFVVCGSMTVSHSARLALGGFLCLSLYSIEVFLQCLGSITMVRVLQWVHLFGRQHSYGTRFPPWFADIFRFKKTFGQRFSDTRLLYGGIVHRLIYFMIWLFFAMACIGTNWTWLDLLLLYVCCM